MPDHRPHLPVPQGQPRFHWKRFALLASGVVTFACVGRLLADAAGVQRGTVSSAAVSAASMFGVMLAIGLFFPHVMHDTPPSPLLTWRRLRVLVPFSLLYALFNFWLQNATL